MHFSPFFRPSSSSITRLFSSIRVGRSCVFCDKRTEPSASLLDPGNDGGLIRASLASGLVVVVASSLGFGYWSQTQDSWVAFADHHAPSGFADHYSDVGESSQENEKPRFLFGDNYRRRVFFNYEKRIRLRSPPEKVFEYFASVKAPDGQVFMTPADLMRAVVPVFPPSESNHVRTGNLKGERPPGELRCAPSEFFMLFDTNGDGLISFAEYIFLVTLLSIPESSFSVAFKMFDLDHNGEIDLEEFKKVMGLMRAYNRQGRQHRGGKRTGLKVTAPVENGGLLEHFFGKDGKQLLEHDKFVEFLRDLQDEIVRLEFAHYDYNLKGKISAKDFALSMIASADMSHTTKFLDRVDDISNNPQLKHMQITYEEFKNFAQLRKRLRPLSLALFSHGKVNGFLAKEDFQRAASHVCGITLTNNVVDIIFHVFDTNGDGSLSSDEFLRVLQKREKEISSLPREKGLKGLLSCWLDCTRGDCSSPSIFN